MIPQLSFRKETFWDYDLSTMNPEQHASFIISRVLMNGSWKEWNDILEYYGSDRIKKELLKTRYLDKRSLNYASVIFDIPKEQFRCYTLMQSAPPLWDY
jgi:hypothetical protein